MRAMQLNALLKPVGLALEQTGGFGGQALRGPVNPLAENACLLLSTTAEEQDPSSSREPKGRNDP